MTTHTETMWAIVGKDGFYGGTTWLTRTDAITSRCWYGPYSGIARIREWANHRNHGDRAVKVTITYKYPD